MLLERPLDKLPNNFSEPEETPPSFLPRARVKGYTVAKRYRDAMPGMHEVLAEDAAGARVVLRVPPDHHFAARLRAEAELSRRHAHQAIVQSVGVVEVGRWPVQVLEHIDGMRLDALTRTTGALPPEAVCRIGARLGLALAELHVRKPVVHHGALSADRVIIDVDGDVRLRDLGRLWTDGSERHLSPERRAAEGRSAQDDLYALGVVLLEAALGEPIDLGDGFLDPRVIDGLLPDRLVDALSALLAPIERRLQTADAVVRIFSGLEASFGDGGVALRLAVAHGRDQEPPTPEPAPDPITLDMDDTVPLPVMTPELLAPQRTQPALKTVDPASIPPRSDPGPSWDDVGPPGGHTSPLRMIVMGSVVGLLVVGAASMQLGVLPAFQSEPVGGARLAALIPPVELDVRPDPVPAEPAAQRTEPVVPVAKAVAAPVPVPVPAPVAERVAQPVPVEKSVKPAAAVKPAKVNKPVKLAKAPARMAVADEKPAASARDRSDGAALLNKLGAAAELQPPRLILEASASLRARAEQKLAACNVTRSLLGVVHVAGGGVRVSTEPRNACVERVLTAALKGYMASEDQPFEVEPRAD